MTVTPALRLTEGKLVANGHTILTDVPDNVVSTSSLTSRPVHGIFLGALFDHSNSRHVVSLGTLRDVRFMSCFRFKLWWMAQMMGQRGRDVPVETQFLLVETKESSDLDRRNGEDSNRYVVFLPIIEGAFRACLQGGRDDELELCIESGDEETKLSSFTHSLFITAGGDPFETITAAVAAVKSHLKTFRHRSEKKLPSMVDYFGWCTWDAFYQDVTQEGVDAGLTTLAAGGSPAKFVIIDDGWQSVGADHDLGQPVVQKPLLRLTDVKENNKFNKGMAAIVEEAKRKHGVKYVYVWHSIVGYWGGFSPEMKQYEVKMQYPVISIGAAENDREVGKEAMVGQGVGVVSSKQVHGLYEEMHGYLAGAGVDGVKVDSQCVLETVGGGMGGRVELTRQYHAALEASVGKNFPENGCIACMCHNTDGLYCSKQTAVVRASDDFFPRKPVTHTIHIAAVAYNSVFLGEFMQPDWDMFHSHHQAAHYHASARAISGGPIYVSDAPGNHDFQLLRKLVLPDGSILRPRLPGRPTLDCLFNDPTRDGISLLKIWNMNKFTGVLGVYNCQGAAWSAVEKKNVFHEMKSEVVTGAVKAGDVHLLAEAVVGSDWNGDCVAYRNSDGDLVRLPNGAVLSISLKVLQQEIFTLCPVKVLAPGIDFAPVGLVDMYNAGGAIVGLSYQAAGSDVGVADWEAGATNEIIRQPLENRSSYAVGVIELEVKGCGRFGFYSSAKPRKCVVESEMVEFSYDSSSGLGIICLESMPESGKRAHSLMIEV